MAKLFSRLFRTFQWWSWFLLIAAGWIWWRIALTGSFGDEQENFVASWLVQQSFVPYRDFFFHHAPFPYFLGSGLFFFSTEPWQLFRWLVLGWYGLVGWFTWSLLAPKFRPVAGLTWIGLALMAPLLQLHQYLAESLAVPLIVSLLLLYVSYAQTGFPKLNKLLGIWILFGWVMIGCTVVTLPVWLWLSVGLLGTCLVSWHRESWKKLPWLRLVFLGLILSGGTVGYFWQQQALQQAWWAIITYNFQYYFPERLAANAQQIQWGFALSILQNFYTYALTASSTIWQATNDLVHTVFTTIMAALSLPGVVLQNWLLVAWTEWHHKVITLGVLSWLGWILVALFAPKMRWRIVGWLWWLGLAVVLRGRENETFKLSLYYSVVMAGMVGITWNALVAWLRGKRARFWQFLVFCLSAGWLAAWLSLFAPSYLESNKTTSAIIPVKTQAVAARLNQTLTELPGIQSQEKIYILGGNPVFYLLTQRHPVIPEMYYHPWFHRSPELQSAVTEFLSTTTTVPVVLESEIDGSSLNYAAELETLVQSRAIHSSNGVYWMRE